MTEVVASSSQEQQLASSTAFSRPLARSAMATRSAVAGRQHGSETSPTNAAGAVPTTTTSSAAEVQAGPVTATGPSLLAISTAFTVASTSSRPNVPPPLLQTSSAQRGPMTRKRAASIHSDDYDHIQTPRIEDLSLNTPTTARDLICLCTPEPKIPRPRNAFILYRQAHQNQVKLQHKNAANPEISKIIGDRWRDEPESVKEQWKHLAEEEKLRHQRQYPNYRYQPRRGKQNLPHRLTTVTGEDPGRCPNCGGRYIATPRTPSTPFVSPPASATRATSSGMPPPTPFSQRGSDVASADHHFRQSGTMAPHLDSRYRGGRSQWAGRPGEHGHGHGELYGIREDYETMSPSDAKRRRYNSAGSSSYRSYPSLPSPPTPFHPRQPPLRHPSINGPPGSAPQTPACPPPPPSAGPLPGPSSITRAGSHADIGPSLGGMRPPLRPGSISYAPPSCGSGGGPSEFDESLRLPPLQTHLPTSPTSEVGAASAVGRAAYSTDPPPHADSQDQREREAEAHRRNVESIIMSIPYVNKLQVLERISPPLLPPGTTGWIMSPGAEPSGGPRGPIIAIEGSNPRLLRLIAPIIEKALLASGECDVRTWYPSDQPPLSPPPPASTDADTSSRSASIASLPPPSASSPPFTSYLQAMLDWHTKSTEITSFVNTRRRLSDPNPNHKPPLPVALLPAGYALTTSDQFACSVPIGDAYAPVDHWQWMATLWRGIASADLTVYVRTATEEELGRLQGVELKGGGLMVVRVDERELQGGGWGLAEKTERRLGFEVVEWVRGGAFWAVWGEGR